MGQTQVEANRVQVRIALEEQPHPLGPAALAHFPAIDHQILSAGLARVVRDEDACWLIDRIIASGAGILDQEYRPPLFPGDDLPAACRPRGLPIGNLTSQFWSNCYLHPLDLFVKRERRVKSRKVVEATRRLGERFDAWREGRISFGEFHASLQGWIAHVRHADSWGLRGHVLERFVW